MAERRSLPKRIERMLGKVSDIKIAKEMGVAPTTVFAWRKLRGISSSQPKRGEATNADNMSEEELEALIAEQSKLIPTLEWWAAETSRVGER